MTPRAPEQRVRVARPAVPEDDIDRVARLLRAGALTRGVEVTQFEDEFVRLVLADTITCAAVSSGFDALRLALSAAHITTGDEVLVPAFSFVATAHAVSALGARPVFCDIDPDTYTIAAHDASLRVGHRTRAIVAVHLFGHVADMSGLEALADRHGLTVIEDAAQAHGAELDGRRAGRLADIAAFSCYATKAVTTGEGGVVASENHDVVQHVRRHRNHGIDDDRGPVSFGGNARMSEVHAAIGRGQLTRFEASLRQQRGNAAFYDTALSGVGLPQVRPAVCHSYHQYTLTIADDRDGFARALSHEHGIDTAVYYRYTLDGLPMYATTDVPRARHAARTALSIPVGPHLTRHARERVATAVNAVARAGA